MQRSILIAGNGPASWGFVQGYRSAGGRKDLTVVASEWPARNMPGMSKVITGHVPDSHMQWKPENKWRAEVLSGTVQSIDSHQSRATWRDSFGFQVDCSFDVFVAAIGTQPRQMELPRGAWKIVHFHHSQDVVHWKSLRMGQRVVVVGGGLVGGEMVEMAISKGCEVHWLIREPNLWGQWLPPVASRLLQASAESLGVKLYLSCGDVGQRILSLTPALVGVAIGARPRTLEGMKEAIPNVHVVGDAAGGAMGWVQARSEGHALGKALARGEMAPKPSIVRDIPFKASFFNDVVNLVGDWRNLQEQELAAQAIHRHHVVALYESGGHCQTAVTLNVPVDSARVLHALESGGNLEVIQESMLQSIQSRDARHAQTELRKHWETC